MRLQIIFCLYAGLTTEIYGKDVRIIGGQITDVLEYPFMASFRYAIQNIIFCGGAIISNKHILTAAHCLYEKQHEYHKIRIYTGITRSLSIDGGVHEISRVYYHHEYTGLRTNEEMYRHDIAVVEVKNVIQFTENQNMIALPYKGLIFYETGFVMGWGSPSYPIYMFAEQLQKLFMRVLPQNECSNRILFKIHPEQFCGLMRSGMGTCYGDDGGPFIIKNTIAGIASVNYPCARGLPDVYTRVYTYINFIRNIIGT